MQTEQKHKYMTVLSLKMASWAGSMIMELAWATIFRLNTVKIAGPETWKRPVCLGRLNTRVFSRLRGHRF
jgi:hypothetical protein